MTAGADDDVDVSAADWLIPLAFAACAGWLMWHASAFTLDWAPPGEGSAFDRLSAQYRSNDVTPNMPGLFGGFADLLDYLALAGIVVIGAIGIARVRRSHHEHFEWGVFDRLSVFIGRVTMVMIVVLVLVMLWEVMLRYVFERPTLWANELSLWIAGFVFLLSGLYSMQQRSHIRIFILYDMMPRWARRACDVLSTLLIVTFTAALIWGGYGEATDQFYRWETLGTAFDPPIPATLTPAILIVATLITVQAIVNLVRDWNLEPEQHAGIEDIDAEEIAAIKRAVGNDADV